MRKFCPRIESLESRRLFDAAGIDVLDPADVTLQSTVVNNAAIARGLPLIQDFQQSMIVRSGSTVAVVTNADELGNRTLWGIHEGGDAGAEVAFHLGLGKVRVSQMLVDGDRLLVIGQQNELLPVDGANTSNPNPATVQAKDVAPVNPELKLFAVNLSSGELVKELTLPNGNVSQATLKDGNALLLVNRLDLFLPALWPPIDPGQEVYQFHWDESGVSEATKSQLPGGPAYVADGHIVVAVHSFTTDDHFADNHITIIKPTVELRSFKITDAGVTADGSLALGLDYVDATVVDSNADRVVVVGFTHTDQGQIDTRVLVVDLAGDSPSIIKTINVNGSTKLVSHGDGYVLLQDFKTGALKQVDVSDGATDESQIKEITLPDGIRLGTPPVALSGDRLVFVATRVDHVSPPNTEPPIAKPPIAKPLNTRPVDSVSTVSLVTVSLTEHSATVEKLGDVRSVDKLRLIDASTNRFGFESISSAASGLASRSFVFGRLGETGKFVREGQIVAAGGLETFFVGESNVVVVSPNRLTAYAYTDPSAPIYQLRLSDGDVKPLLANDDAFVFYSLPDIGLHPSSDWNLSIDVLANDQVPFASRWETRIVELIGAPDGTHLAGDRVITLDPKTLEGADSIHFKYRISDGDQNSEANVLITVKSITDELRASMIAAVRTKAAADFDLPEDQFLITFDVDKPADGLPNLLPANASPDGSLGNDRFEQSPSFLCKVSAPGIDSQSISALYRVDTTLHAYQVWVQPQPQQPVLTLSLAATDDSGKTIDSIEVGKSFWLEFRGDDLRPSGQGVFSAFLSLTASSGIKFEKTVEAGPGFSLVNGDAVADKIGEHSIRNLGVIDADGTPQGGDRHLLMRIHATATAEGVVEFVAKRSEDPSAETTLFDSTNAVSEDLINRVPTRLQVVKAVDQSDPSDVDGDGVVRATDALRVINMISRFGTGKIEEIAARMLAKQQAVQSPSSNEVELSRYDVNHSGTITPLDALVVINRVGRLKRDASAGGNQTPVANSQSQTAIVDPSFGNDSSIDELAEKRRRK